jgi:SsrA-binding protein
LGTFYNHKIKRERKLLLHKRELEKLAKKTKDVGNTIIPLKLYINDRGKAKLLIALGRGKKLFDKREAIKDRENKRNLDRIMKKS